MFLLWITKQVCFIRNPPRSLFVWSNRHLAFTLMQRRRRIAYSASDTLLEMYFIQYVGYWISSRIIGSYWRFNGRNLWTLNSVLVLFLLLSKFMFLRAIWEQVLVKFLSWQLSCSIWSKNRSQIMRFTCQHFWIITSSCMASSVIRA